MVSKEGLTLHQKALDALRNSTKMLKVAAVLRRQGNKAEADRLQDDARAQRTISTLLMAEAQNRETEARLVKQGLHSRIHERTGDSLNTH